MSEGELQLMRALFAAERVDQSETFEIMRQVEAACGFQIDPHSAVGVGAAQRAVLADGVPMVTLATAHPAKFPKAVIEAYDQEPETPQRVIDIMGQRERFAEVPNELLAVETHIREKSRIG
jgi:threonine synthase